MGNLVVTGIINGADQGNPDGSGSLEDQCERMFARIPEVLKAAGCGLDNIVKLNVGMTDLSQRKVLNHFWTQMFPDAAHRPVRQTTQVTLDPGKFIQCDILAWID
jgi:2-iminobutanoate/2-iminopropanoate deaminase